MGPSLRLTIVSYSITASSAELLKGGQWVPFSNSEHHPVWNDIPRVRVHSEAVSATSLHEVSSFPNEK